MAARSRKKPEKVDVRKVHPELYRAARDVAQFRVGRGTYLAVDGIGEPGGRAFQEAVGRLFAVAYAAKFALKAAGIADFAVPPFECLWFDDPSRVPRDQWRWRLLIRIPDGVSARDLRPVRRSLADRKQLDSSTVKRIAWTEGPALQTLHVGPYDAVGAAYERLAAAARERGLACAGPGHEVYLSDPRRAAPEKLRTIVRMGVRRAVKR